MANRKLSRRDVLRGAAAGSAGLLIGGQGLPAFGQEKAPELDLPQGAAGKLTVIHRTEYFEAAQTAFRDTVTEFAAANNVELDISTTNPESFGDFMGKMTAAVKAGNPPDFAYTSNVSIPQMHLLDLVEDVTDVVDEAVSKYGNIMPGLNAAKTGQFDGALEGHSASSAPLPATYIRGDKLKEKGIDPATLKTFSDRREAALAISGPDFYGWGVTPNQSGDGFGYLILAIQAFGGHFTDETGQIVQFDSPETVAAFEWLKETYDRNGKYAAMLPPGVESWTDTSNNEAFLAGQIGYTHNAFSVYAQSKRDNNPVYDNIVLLPAPQANNGDSRDGGNVGGWLTIFKGSQERRSRQEAGARTCSTRRTSARCRQLGGVLFTPAYANLWTDELLATDPNLAIIKAAGQRRRTRSSDSPGRPTRTPASTPSAPRAWWSRSVANAISGRMTPADAVKDAHQKMVDIFEEGGIMQP